MDWGFLSFLAEPWFVIPWYAVGLAGAVQVIHDIRTHNTVLKHAIAWAWPIIVLFFSVIGLALYWFTARAPNIEDLPTEEAKQAAHDEYQRNMFRRVNGAVIHCVAGDGLGIMTAMVIARAVGMSFWQEFWFEYLVGFLFGWLIFQLKSMTMMTDSLGRALALAFRAEFFSMLTVMGGMGAVMTWVTPMVETAQPTPLTYAFWGFGMLGLLVGYVLTFPMNWAMVRLGWKHGMGSPEGARPVRSPGLRLALQTGMVLMGAAGLVLPAWLTEVRNTRTAGLRPEVPAHPVQATDAGGKLLQDGLRTSLRTAVDMLDAGQRSRAAVAMDAARRVAEIGKEAAPGSALASAQREIRRARHDLQVGRPDRARGRLEHAVRSLAGPLPSLGPPPRLDSYRGATVVDPHGLEIGEVVGVSGDSVKMELGGRRDVWGLVDLGPARKLAAPAEALAFGPAGPVGPKLVALMP